MKNWLKALPDLDLLQCLIYGEGRGERIEGQIGIACVVRNRALNPNWWGKTWQEVMLKPYQFSCFNEDDPNLEKIKTRWRLRRVDNAWRLARWVAGGVLFDWVPDITYGANHYHSNRVKPDWADPLKVTVGLDRHLFYKL